MEGARDSTSSSRRNIVCKIFDVETVRVALRPSQVVGRRPRLDGEAAIELRHAPPRRRVDGASVGAPPECGASESDGTEDRKLWAAAVVF